MKKIVPLRFHTYYPNGRYSMTAAADFIADMGFDGIDVSLENVDVLEDMWELVLYSLAMRVRGRGLSMPVCHVKYAMPDPYDSVSMRWFTRDIATGIKAAKLMGIPTAVIHPIALRESKCSKDEWFARNREYLMPLAELAHNCNVKLAVENMADMRRGDHLFGSYACEITSLAGEIDGGVCWDFGHANVSGFKSGAGLGLIGDRLEAVHIHDNDGIKDGHLLPFTGTVNWDAAIGALKKHGFDKYIDLEVKTSDLPNDLNIRTDFASDTLAVARRIEKMLTEK